MPWIFKLFSFTCFSWCLKDIYFLTHPEISVTYTPRGFLVNMTRIISVFTRQTRHLYNTTDDAVAFTSLVHTAWLCSTSWYKIYFIPSSTWKFKAHLQHGKIRQEQGITLSFKLLLLKSLWKFWIKSEGMVEVALLNCPRHKFVNLDRKGKELFYDRILRFIIKSKSRWDKV